MAGGGGCDSAEVQRVGELAGLVHSGTRSAVVRRAVRLHRRSGRAETGAFLAEGPQAVREAIKAGVAIELLTTQTGAERFGVLLGAFGAANATDGAETDAASSGAHAHVSLLTEAAMVRACDAVHPQPIAAICRQHRTELADVVRSTPIRGTTKQPVTQSTQSTPGSSWLSPQPTALLVMLVDCQDPGNVGTVVRLADAVGARAVVISAGSADPFGPKAVRASTGSIFHVPVVTEVDPNEVLSAAAGSGITTIAAAGDAEQDVFELSADGQLHQPTMWVFGNEAHGLPAALRVQCRHEAAVPIFGQAESLNLATAAALCLYQSALAQRR